MKILPALLLALCLIGGCGLNRPAVERNTFLIQPERGGAPGSAPAGTLRLGAFKVAPPFDGRGFVYRRDEQRYETDFYNEYAADPAAMLEAASADWLRRSGLFSVVLASRVAATEDLQLEAAITALYVDFRSPTPAAVLAIRWHLTRPGGGVREWGDEARIPLATRTPVGAAEAQREALSRILAGLEAALR